MTRFFPVQLFRSLATVLLIGSCTPQHRAAEAIRIRWAHDPETLDPLALHNQSAMDASNLLHMGLLQADSAPLAIVPALAAQLPIMGRRGDSLTTFRYTLRPTASWDDGHPVLAADVACTLKLMNCPGLPNEVVRQRFGIIRQIELDSLNPRSFTLVCQGTAPELLITSGDFFVLPEAVLDAHYRLRRYSLPQLQQLAPAAPTDSVLQAVARRYLALDLANRPGQLPGCGAYQLVGWVKDHSLSFQRKTRWWGQAVAGLPLSLQPRAPRLEYVVLPTPSAATLALRRGDLDVFPQIPATDFDHLRAAADPALRLYTSDSYDVAVAGFNTRHPALADARTRQALSRLFDTAGLLRATQHGSGHRTASLVPPFDRANYNDSLQPVPFDPAGARRLLRQAGWQPPTARQRAWQRATPRGTQQLLLLLRYRAEDNVFATAALQFRAAATQLGIAVELRPTESAAFGKTLAQGDFDLYLRTLRGNPFNNDLTPLLHSASSRETNPTGFGTPACDRLLVAIASTAATPRRTRQLRQLQALLQQEAPLVPLFFLPNRVAARRNLTGLYVSSLKPGFVAATIERTASAARR